MQHFLGQERLESRLTPAVLETKDRVPTQIHQEHRVESRICVKHVGI